MAEKCKRNCVMYFSNGTLYAFDGEQIMPVETAPPEGDAFECSVEYADWIETFLI